MGRMLECSKLTFQLRAKGIKLTNLFSFFQKQVRPYSPINFPQPQLFIKISYFLEILRISINYMLSDAGLDLLRSLSGALSALLTTGILSYGNGSETAIDFGVFPWRIFVDMNSFFLLIQKSTFLRRSYSALGLIPMSRLSRDERILLNFYKNLLLEGVSVILVSESLGTGLASSASSRWMSEILIQYESVGRKGVYIGLFWGSRVVEQYLFGRWRRHEKGRAFFLIFIGSIYQYNLRQRNCSQNSQNAYDHFRIQTNLKFINSLVFSYISLIKYSLSPIYHVQICWIRLVLVYNLMFFKEGSQVSEYQNTAFFQNSEANKVSIFDNALPSESQIAYEMFNVDSAQGKQKHQKSLISQLDLFDRSQDFAQTPLHAEPRFGSKRDTLMESQESKDSRMTFGAKLTNKLKESKAEQSKFYQEPKEPSKPKVAPVAPAPLPRQRPNQPVSNFSIQSRQGPYVNQPDSMPVKFEGNKFSLKAAYDPPSNSSNSSSFSIDIEEIRQRNQLQVKPIAKMMTSLRLNNQNEVRDGRSESGESGKSERSDNISNDSKWQEKEGVKEKKFGFTLRRSRVNQEGKDNKSPQTGFSLKNTASSIATPSNFAVNGNILIKQEIKTVKVNEKNPPQTSDDNVTTPFKLKLKDNFNEGQEKILMSSIVKKFEPQKGLFLNKTPQESRLTLQLDKTPTFEKDSKKVIENKANQVKINIDDLFNLNQSSVKSDQESKKRQSIGLKQQLKKLTSRPTEKVQLKSIAFNKGFKLKTKAQDKQLMKTEESLPSKEIGIAAAPGFIIQRFDPEAKNQQRNEQRVEQRTSNRPFMSLKEQKMDIVQAKTAKPTEFSKYMLILMELQQESEVLQRRAERSRNFYRELAILNNDINRRIEESLRDVPRK